VESGEHVLDDVLEKGLKVVFVGMAAGDRSAEQQAYYAGHGNKFWDVLAEVGLTERLLQPEEFRLLPRWGIGLTDIAKFAHGTDNNLRKADFDVQGFRDKMCKYRPRIIAFNGKKAARIVLRRPTGKLEYGMQPDRLESAEVWVLPSTSGAGCRYWDPEHWCKLAQACAQRSV
jgi:double-stranded uracil-DNA glycosylase